MRAPIAVLLITPLVLGGLPASAQNPSADQIINSLRPNGNPATGGTRGIRLAAPGGNGSSQTPPAPGAAPTAQPSEPRLASNKPAAAAPANPAVNLTVNFATGSAELTPDAIHTLDELGRALASKDLTGYRFRIEGHTDTVGTHDHNQTLSERRAEAVVDYVARKYGVDPGRLQAVGMGETGLLVQTPPQTAEPRNRRVQVINLGA
jgi:outer membrane protein OmpA-like peptidoglycan-associated protein